MTSSSLVIACDINNLFFKTIPPIVDPALNIIGLLFFILYTVIPSGSVKNNFVLERCTVPIEV